MNSRSGAIPKTTSHRRRIRLPSSDSEAEIQRNIARNVITEEIKQETLNPSRRRSRRLMGNDSGLIDIPWEVVETIKVDTSFSDLNIVIEKYENQSLCDPTKCLVAKKAPAETCAAAQTTKRKNNVVDLRHKAALKRETVVKVEPPKSTKTALVTKAKPILLKNKSSQSTTVTSSVNKTTAARIAPSYKGTTQNDVWSNARFALSACAAPKISSIKPSTFKRSTNKVSTVKTGLSTCSSKIVPKTTQAKKAPTVKLETVGTIDLRSPCGPKALKVVASPARGPLLECPVCFEHLLAGRPTVITSCGHMFCRACVDTIKFGSNKCPICRVELFQVIDIHV